MEPCVAVIHATRVAVTPIEKTFERIWPEVDTVSLLDESLSRDLEKSGELTPPLTERVGRLARFARDAGVDAILFSCSAFGVAIEAARSSIDIPVLKPNEAMLEEALAAGPRIRLLATYKPSIPSMLKEFKEMSSLRGQSAEPETCYVPGALDALASGNREKHDELIAGAAVEGPPCDVVVLAQFSMASAFERVSDYVESKVVTSPVSAVLRLKEQISMARSSL